MFSLRKTMINSVLFFFEKILFQLTCQIVDLSTGLLCITLKILFSSLFEGIFRGDDLTCYVFYIEKIQYMAESSEN